MSIIFGFKHFYCLHLGARLGATHTHIPQPFADLRFMAETWTKPEPEVSCVLCACVCVCAARALVNPLQSLEERPLVSSFPCWNTLCQQQQHTINACPAHVAYTQCGSHCTRWPTVLARLIILLNSTLNCIKYRAHFNYARIIRADE